MVVRITLWMTRDVLSDHAVFQQPGQTRLHERVTTIAAQAVGCS